MATFRDGIPLPNRHQDVTPAGADVDLPKHCVMLVINGTVGVVVVEDHFGTAVTYASATMTALNQVLIGQWAKVLDSGTTATEIICHSFDPTFL